jgi:Glycosyl hydrolase family 47
VRHYCQNTTAEANRRRRPEAIESVFILYRITGDTAYQDIAWEMFESINNATRTDLANSAIDDVTQTSPVKGDRMESFWLAETLKYFYLIFSEPDLISLDDYVLYVLSMLRSYLFARPCNSHEGGDLANSFQEHRSTSLPPVVLKKAGHGFKGELGLYSSLHVMVRVIFGCFRIRTKYITRIKLRSILYQFYQPKLAIQVL